MAIGKSAQGHLKHVARSWPFVVPWTERYMDSRSAASALSHGEPKHSLEAMAETVFVQHGPPANLKHKHVRPTSNLPLALIDVIPLIGFRKQVLRLEACPLLFRCPSLLDIASSCARLEKTFQSSLKMLLGRREPDKE